MSPPADAEQRSSEVDALLSRTHERLALGDAPGALHALLEALQRIGAGGGAIEAVARSEAELVYAFKKVLAIFRIVPPFQTPHCSTRS